MINKSSIYKLFENIYSNMLENDIKISKNIVIDFNISKSDLKSIFAFCTNKIDIDSTDGYLILGDSKSTNCSVISLNPNILKLNLKDLVDFELIRNTIAHELIHTVSGCVDHNAKFLKLGKLAKKILKLNNDVGFIGTEEETKILTLL